MELTDIIEEAYDIVKLSEAKRITARLIGGIGIFYFCPSALKPPFNRKYNDIDIVSLSNESKALTELLEGLNYRSNQKFNALYGYKRLIFNNIITSSKVDVFLDKFEMSHKFDFRERIYLCSPSLPISDLLMYKLQIVKINGKDINDILVILLDHEFGDDPCNEINIKYINTYTSNNWGIYKTFIDNLNIALESIGRYSINESQKRAVTDRILTLKSRIESSPKSTIWKIRNKIGARKKWYEDVEEGIT